LAGIALLLLRAAFGVAIVVEGGFYIGESNPTPVFWLIGIAGFTTGALLISGFLTPIAAGIVAANALGIWISLLPPATPTLFDSRTAVFFGVAILTAILGLGPGAFSVDARVFGRREIIIPPLSER